MPTDPDPVADTVTYDCTCPWCRKQIEDMYEYTTPGYDEFQFACPDCGGIVDGIVITRYRLERGEAPDARDE